VRWRLSGSCADSFSSTLNQDCSGNDLEQLENLDWTSPADVERCAARCMELVACVGFNFGHEGASRANEVCYMKSASSSCSTSSSWDFYRKTDPDPDTGCAARWAALDVVVADCPGQARAFKRPWRFPS
jgi:hypothetical protein